MKVKFKKLHKDAVSPKFAHKTDAGADLTATSIDFSRDRQVVYGTGLCVEIPEGMVGLLFPRSSVRNQDLIMSNCVGVIDAGYLGEIMVTFNIKMDVLLIDELHSAENLQELSNEIFDVSYDNIYEVGDRIAQLVIMPVPLVQYTEVEELSETERNTSGHGSTGN